jgi:hypothetical protein
MSVCKEVYSDPNASPALRLKAAGLALPHEVPRLESVPPPLDLAAEPYEPLADVIARQRVRAEKIAREDPFFQRYLPKDNGSGDDSSGKCNNALALN